MKATKRMAFTLIELLVVISIIALLIGILLPALGAARRTARQMQSNAQLRGIQQSMVMFAQGNGDHFPGLDSNGKLPAPSGGAIAAAGNLAGQPAFMFGTMLDNNYFTGEYIISPSETKTTWTTDGLSTSEFSYAALQITDKAGPATGAATDPDGVNQGRRNEWSQTLNTEAIVLSDRAIADSGAASVGSSTTGFHSVTTSKGSNTWRGGVAWNDNHVTFESTALLQTRYSSGAANTDDNLFDPDDNATGGSSDSPDKSYNGSLVYSSTTETLAGD